MTRLKYCATKDMSPEELKQHKRDLQKRWRTNHPDWVKASNKHWSEVYSQTKPFKCTCVDCGREFNASRNTPKHCPRCRAERVYVAEMRKKTIALRQEKRKAEYAQIIEMYKDGHTQEIIAETFGRSQSGISSIIRRLG